MAIPYFMSPTKASVPTFLIHGCYIPFKRTVSRKEISLRETNRQG